MPVNPGDRGSIYVEPTQEALRLIDVLQRDLPREMERQLKRDLREAGKVVAKRARQLLRQQKGTRYRTRRGSRLRKAGTSKPGQPPAYQRGDLARSIKYRASRSSILVSVFTGGGGAHGRIFEFAKNTPRTTGAGFNRGALAKRPFLSRALDENETVISAIIQKALQNALDSANK